MSAPRRKLLTEKDRADWAAYARLVRPLDGHSTPASAVLEHVISPMESTAAPVVVAASPKPARRDEAKRAIAVGDQPGGLDKSSWNRLRSGKLTPVRILDLHGRTVQHAHQALHSFLIAAHADNVRCVEVITGRGSGENGGAIRRELPMWLNSPGLRPLVLGASYPHAANTGAVRLLLRRVR